MASLYTPGPSRPFSWRSQTPSTQHFSPSSITNFGQSIGTPRTRGSAAITVTPDVRSPTRKPTIEFVDPLAQRPRIQKRKSSKLPWSRLFRSKSHIPRGYKRDYLLRRATVGEEPESRTGSVWWSTNRSASLNPILKPIASPSAHPRPAIISPPVPIRPDHLHRLKSLQTVQESERLAKITEEKSEHSQPLQIDRPPHPPTRSQTSPALTTVDSDKREPEFSRIHSDGWAKVIPKYWMEDQFSQNDSDTDEERSVYSQDNGEEEARRKTRPKPRPLGNEHGFPAGEMTPLGQNSSAAGHFNQRKTPSGHISFKLPTRQKGKNTPRPSGKLSASPSTSSPVQRWLSGVRPPSDTQPLSPSILGAHIDPYQRHLIESEGGSENGNLPRKSASASGRAAEISFESASGSRVSTWKDSESDSLLPSPLKPHRESVRQPETTPQRLAEESWNPSDILPNDSIYSPTDQAPLLESVQSSWTTIPHARGGSDARTEATKRPSQEIPTARQAKRESDKNKPLPLLPGEFVEVIDGNSQHGGGLQQDEVPAEEEKQQQQQQPQQVEKHGEDDACNPSRKHGHNPLSADIDDIINLYIGRDSQSREQQHITREQNTPTPTAINSSAANIPQQPDHPHIVDNETPTRTTPLPSTPDSHTPLLPPPPPPPPPPRAPIRGSTSTRTSTTTSTPGPHTSTAGSTSTAKTKPPTPPPPRIVASFPILYDAMSYPELRHARQRPLEQQARQRESGQRRRRAQARSTNGRPTPPPRPRRPTEPDIGLDGDTGMGSLNGASDGDGNGNSESRRPRSQRVVVLTHVDEHGRTWI